MAVRCRLGAAVRDVAEVSGVLAAAVVVVVVVVDMAGSAVEVGGVDC